LLGLYLSWLPSININGGLGSAYSSAAATEFNFFNQLNYNFNQYLSLSVNIPIFLNKEIQSKIASSEIKEKIVKKQIDQQKLKLDQYYQKLFLEIDLLKEKLKFSEINASVQNIAYISGRERFSEGILNSTELNTLRLSAEKAKVQLLQTQIEYDFKIKTLEVFVE
jgi:outer membrane protein